MADSANVFECGEYNFQLSEKDQLYYSHCDSDTCMIYGLVVIVVKITYYLISMFLVCLTSWW